MANGLPRGFGGGAVRQGTALYVFNGGVKRTIRGIQVRDGPPSGGVYRRTYDNFAPTVTPINISHFVDPTPVGGQKRVQATYADPPNNALNPPDYLANEWYWRVMIKSPRYLGGTQFIPANSYQSQFFGATTDWSPYLALVGDQVYIEVYLRRNMGGGSGTLGPGPATTTATTVT